MSLLWADDMPEVQARHEAWKKAVASAQKDVQYIEQDLEWAKIDVAVNEERLEDARFALNHGADIAANEVELVKASLAEARDDVDHCTRALADAQAACNALVAEREKLPEHVAKRLNAVGLRDFFVAMEASV